MEEFIVTSNIFFAAPILAAFWMHEWVYFYLAIVAGIVSPIFHYLFESEPRTLICRMLRVLDWSIAVFAYCYMFYFIFAKDAPSFRAPLALGLVASIIFFWYGFRSSNYEKLHPWFHVVTPLLSAAVVLAK